MGDRGQDCSQGDKNVLNLKNAIETRGDSAMEGEAKRNKWMRLKEWVRQEVQSHLHTYPKRERC